MTLNNKKPIVVITGASSGIGAATAKKFGHEGYHVALLARRKDRLEELQKQLPSASVHELDVRSSEDVLKVFDEIERKEGPIDILINNAGAAYGLDPAYSAKLEDWEKCVAVNINGLLYCTKAVLPHMVKRDKGQIINLGSIAASYSYPGGNVYGATKAFVHQFSLNLRADLLGTKVRVNCIEPGIVETEFSTVRFHGDKKRASSVYENAESLQADDIAQIIFFCATVPSHVNINTIEVMPVCQASQALAIHRKV